MLAQKIKPHCECQFFEILNNYPYLVNRGVFIWAKLPYSAQVWPWTKYGRRFTWQLKKTERKVVKLKTATISQYNLINKLPRKLILMNVMSTSLWRNAYTFIEPEKNMDKTLKNTRTKIWKKLIFVCLQLFFKKIYFVRPQKLFNRIFNPLQKSLYLDLLKKWTNRL